MQQVTTDKLVQDLNAVVRDAEELIKATVGIPNERISAIRERAQESLRAATASLAKAKEHTVTQVKDAVRTTDAYVHENPWKVLGMAAGAGVLLGLLMQRRPTRH